jgi:hypothetical protein
VRRRGLTTIDCGNLHFDSVRILEVDISTFPYFHYECFDPDTEIGFDPLWDVRKPIWAFLQTADSISPPQNDGGQSTG